MTNTTTNTINFEEATTNNNVTVTKMDHVGECLVKMQSIAQKGSRDWNNTVNDLYDSIKNLITTRLFRRFGAFIRANRDTSNNGTDIVDDLIHRAWQQIMTNYDKYDPTRALGSTFVVWCIDTGAQEEIYDLTSTSQHYSMHIIRIRQATKELQEQGIVADVPTLNLYTGIPMNTVRACLKIMQRQMGTYSIERDGADDDESDTPRGLAEILADTSASTPDTAMQNIEKHEIDDCLKSMPELYGLSSETVANILDARLKYNISVQSIADSIGVSLETVNKVIKKAKPILKQKLTDKGFGESPKKDADRCPELNDRDIVPQYDIPLIRFIETDENLMQGVDPATLKGRGRPNKIIEMAF